MRMLGVKARTVTECGLCGSGLRPVLQLGASPPTCSMAVVGERPPAETHYPLDVLYCDACGLAQLSVVVDPAAVFPIDYPYSSGNSKALHDNFEGLVQQVTESIALAGDDLVVDIGANDGTLLSKFSDYQKCRTIGVEPTRQVDRIEGATFTYRAFFDARLARRIVADYGQAKVITACNVLAHVEDIHEVMTGIEILLADDGVLVAENHDLASVVDGGQWDTVYHEHLRFWSPHSFAGLLQRYDFRPVGLKQIPTHGGSFRITARRGAIGELPSRLHYDFEALAAQAAETRRALRALPSGLTGIGATARATTIINYCGLDVEDIECVCEVAGSDKIGRYIPGTRIPVVDESALFERQQDAVLFSWHMADLIIPKLRERGYHGEIIVPLPSVYTHRELVEAR